MGRVFSQAAGVVFLLWVVFVAAKFVFIGGLAAFGLFAWNTRPGVGERELRAEQARQERPTPPEERAREAVQGTSTVTLRLIERRWLRATVEARNPTAAAVDLEGVRCRVLFSPDGGQPRDISNRGSWRIRVEPGASHRGDVAFHETDVSAVVAPVALAEYRCRLRVRVVPPPTVLPGAPSNPVRMTPSGYRGWGGRRGWRRSDLPPGRATCRPP